MHRIRGGFYSPAGKITAESTPGEGSVFGVMLPAECLLFFQHVFLCNSQKINSR
jgi:hypothetical protein